MLASLGPMDSLLFGYILSIHPRSNNMVV